MRAKWILLLLLISSLQSLQAAMSVHQYYFDGEPEKALEQYTLLTQTKPSVMNFLNTALILQDLGRTKEAVSMLEKAIRSLPHEPQIVSSLGWAYLYEGEWNKAKNMFGKMTTGANANFQDVFGLSLATALAEIKNGNHAKAIKLFEELARQRPKFAPVYYCLGKIYEFRGNTEQAIAAYQRAIKEDSHFVEVRPFLASLFERRKQHDDAWRQYAKIVTVDPGNKPAREKKEKLIALLSKKPDEILPPKNIVYHSVVRPAPERDKVPRLKIGIGTSAGGKPATRKGIYFRTAKSFNLTETATGKTITKGSAGESWQVRLSPNESGTAELINPKGTTAAHFKGSVLIQQEEPENNTIILRNIAYAPGSSWGGTADKELRGDIEIILDEEGENLSLINHVNLEEYLYGVVAAEMPTHWPLEALKAQSVIARTQAVYRQQALKSHQAQGYDLCDEQHCQVYTGLAVESEKARSTVDNTRGQIITYEGKPAHTVFFSNCGGHTQSGKESGWGNVSYWQGVSDGKDTAQLPHSPWELKEWLKNTPETYCNIQRYVSPPEFRWTRIILAKDLENKISRNRFIGRIKGVTPLKRSQSGHVTTVKIRGTKGELLLDKEHVIRRTLGLGPLRSTLFVVETFYYNGVPYVFVFYGGGWGHGVGLCQAGAAGRATEGMPYKEILVHYYTGTVIGNLPYKHIASER